MIVATTENVAGHRTVKTLGQCFGVVLRSRGLGGNFVAGLRTIVGGEIPEYTQLLEEARRHALDRLVENATAMGANAVLMMRYDGAGKEQGQSSREISWRFQSFMVCSTHRPASAAERLAWTRDQRRRIGTLGGGLAKKKIRQGSLQPIEKAQNGERNGDYIVDEPRMSDYQGNRSLIREEFPNGGYIRRQFSRGRRFQVTYLYQLIGDGTYQGRERDSGFVCAVSSDREESCCSP